MTHEPQTKIVIEEFHLQCIVLGRLLRRRTAVDDDLVQVDVLRAEPILAGQPFEIAWTSAISSSISLPLYLPNGTTFCSLIRTLLSVRVLHMR